MTSYIIERDRASWVLRQFGQHESMEAGPTAEGVLERAMTRVRQHAPCTVRILRPDLVEWRLNHPDGEWFESFRYESGTLARRAFHAEGHVFSCEPVSPGVSTVVPARESNDHWVVTVDDGAARRAFEAGPDDGHDLTVFDARVLAWWRDSA